MLFLMFVQSLFQFGAIVGKWEGYYGEKIILICPLSMIQDNFLFLVSNNNKNYFWKNSFTKLMYFILKH